MTRDERADTIRSHFESEAKVFDELILKLIPGYPEMVAELLGALPFAPSQPIRVLDLGCGTGAIARCIGDAFPDARLTCLDVAPKMVASAQQKLAGRAATFVVADFASADLGGPFDAIVSSLALHHLESAEEKVRMYHRIHTALVCGGVFVNADVVLGGNDWLSRRAIARWTDWMTTQVGLDEVRQNWLPKYEAEDRPARLIDHLHWLGQAGFVDVDVLWKHLNFAVYCGRKA